MKKLREINRPEQWKLCPYGQNYYVSDQGRVKKEFKNSVWEIGYVENDYRCNAKQFCVKIDNKIYRVSRLVWETFVGEIPDGMCVAKKNGIWRDNSLYNLELKTQSEVVTRHNIKSKSQAIYCKDNGKIYSNIHDCAKKVGFTEGHIRMICKNKIKDPGIQLYWYSDELGKYFRGDYKEHVRVRSC